MKRSTRPRSAISFAVCGAALLGGPANGWTFDTGVSDDRVSLPEGPGSLEGVGEKRQRRPQHGPDALLHPHPGSSWIRWSHPGPRPSLQLLGRIGADRDGLVDGPSIYRTHDDAGRPPIRRGRHLRIWRRKRAGQGVRADRALIARGLPQSLRVGVHPLSFGTTAGEAPRATGKCSTQMVEWDTSAQMRRARSSLRPSPPGATEPSGTTW